MENKGYRKLLKALSCGCSPGLLRGFGRALRAQGSRLSWALQCLCLCQSREVPALGLSLFLQPPWVPGAAWLCPSPAASYLVSVITWLLQLLFLSGEGTFVSQEMAPECGSSGSAVELLLCSSQGSAAAPEAAGPKSFAGLGQEELQSEASSDLSPVPLAVAVLEDILGLDAQIAPVPGSGLAEGTALGR